MGLSEGLQGGVAGAGAGAVAGPWGALAGGAVGFGLGLLGGGSSSAPTAMPKKTKPLDPYAGVGHGWGSTYGNGDKELMADTQDVIDRRTQYARDGIADIDSKLEQLQPYLTAADDLDKEIADNEAEIALKSFTGDPSAALAKREALKRKRAELDQGIKNATGGTVDEIRKTSTDLNTQRTSFKKDIDRFGTPTDADVFSIQSMKELNKDAPEYKRTTLDLNDANSALSNYQSDRNQYLASVGRQEEALGNIRLALDEQGRVVGMARNAAEGNAPSAAQAQLLQGRDMAMGDALSIAANQRGASGALAGREAMLANAATMQRTNQQMAVLRVQEMAQAREQYNAATGQLGTMSTSYGNQASDITGRYGDLASKDTTIQSNLAGHAVDQGKFYDDQNRYGVDVDLRTRDTNIRGASTFLDAYNSTKSREQQNETTRFTGGVTQRGQDITGANAANTNALATDEFKLKKTAGVLAGVSGIASNPNLFKGNSATGTGSSDGIKMELK